MTLIPDVPVVVVIVHIVALVSLLAHGVVINWQRFRLLRQNSGDAQGF